MKWRVFMDGTQAIIKDTAFSLSHKNHIEKIAMVGDKNWLEWIMRFMDTYTSKHKEYLFWILSRPDSST